MKNDTTTTNFLQNNNNPDYLTQREVADLLQVSFFTLWYWHTKSILLPLAIGNRIYYRKCDIEALIALGKKRGDKAI